MIDEKTMIRVIDARLHYIFSSLDKYSVEEANALINLLKEYNPNVLNNDEREIHIDKECCQDQDPETIIALIAITTFFTVLVLIELLELD